MPQLERPSDPDALLAAVRRFVSDDVLPRVGDWDRDDVLPEATFDRLVELGLMAALVPPEYGGPGPTSPAERSGSSTASARSPPHRRSTGRSAKGCSPTTRTRRSGSGRCTYGCWQPSRWRCGPRWRSTRAPATPGSWRRRPRCSPRTRRSGRSTGPPGWPPAAHMPPTTSSPGCAATRRRADRRGRERRAAAGARARRPRQLGTGPGPGGVAGAVGRGTGLSARPGDPRTAPDSGRLRTSQAPASHSASARPRSVAGGSS